ncbi:MAG: hypothetical protein KAQ70_03070 [Candidatus Heimdallarchaeota archaeon]|nr:hypothetical protein [Candidatus Heimdallarchaeota archaeon]
MSIYRNSKFFASGSILVAFFYVILGILLYFISGGYIIAIGLFDVIGGWDASQILYAPIIIGLAGMGKAALNFSNESEFTWERGKQIAIFIFAGSGILLLGLLLLILTEWVITDILIYLSGTFLILSNIVYAIGFFFLQKQLAALYLKRVIVRYPKYFISIGFGVQAISYTLFFINWFISNEIVTATIEIAGIVLAVISILLLIVGFIPINIAFRAYPHLVENEEIRPG